MSLILNLVRKTELMISRQMFAHLYRMTPNNRYSSDDTGGHNNSSGYSSSDETDGSDGTSNSSETNSDIDKQLSVSQQKQQKLEKAKQKLSELINEMKAFPGVPQTESVISKVLAKPVTHIRRSARPEAPPPPQPEPIDDISKGIDKRLVIAAKVIANTLSGDQAKQTESELLRLLREHAEETEAAKQGIQPKSDDLASIFLGMKVDHKKSPTRPGDVLRDDRKKRDTLPLHEKLKRPMTAVKGRVNLYVSEPLGIFDADMKNKTDEFDTMSGTKMYIWDRLMKDEIEQCVTQSPKNAFEEMIAWTEQGKLWRFPMDSEQGLEEEASVPFYEHVMLDHLLEDFPERGPVRQFMELVLMGLSSNPYITVQRKKDTVAYYREYFKQNEGILKASGALS